MSWTYSGDPSQSTLDAVRFLIGDTDSADAQLQNEEIAYLLAQNQLSSYQAAIQACASLQAKYARKASKTTGDLSIQWDSVAKHYADLRSTLKADALKHAVPIPYAGGISKSDMEIDDENDDLVGPNFGLGMDDNGGSVIREFNRAIPAG